MSTAKLYRLSALALIVASALIVLGVIPTFTIGDDSGSSFAATTALLRVLGSILFVVGLPGLYLRQAERTGLLGLLGFVLTSFYVLILGVAGDTINAFVIPFIAVQAPALMKGSFPSSLETFFTIGQFMALLGGILFGIATLRAAILSRWASILLLVGTVLSFTGNFLLPLIGTVGVILFCVSFIWLSIGVWSYRQPAVQSELPSNSVRV